MGWCGGSSIMATLIETLVKLKVEPKVRQKIYVNMIRELENSDWDTQEECLGMDPEYDKALKKRHPDWDWTWAEEEEP